MIEWYTSRNAYTSFSSTCPLSPCIVYCLCSPPRSLPNAVVSFLSKSRAIHRYAMRSKSKTSHMSCTLVADVKRLRSNPSLVRFRKLRGEVPTADRSSDYNNHHNQRDGHAKNTAPSLLLMLLNKPLVPAILSAKCFFPPASWCRSKHTSYQG